MLGSGHASVFVGAEISLKATQYLEAEGLEICDSYEGATWAVLPAGDSRFLKRPQSGDARLIGPSVVEACATELSEISEFSGQWQTAALPASTRDFPLSTQALVSTFCPRSLLSSLPSSTQQKTSRPRGRRPSFLAAKLARARRACRSALLNLLPLCRMML